MRWLEQGVPGHSMSRLILAKLQSLMWFSLSLSLSPFPFFCFLVRLPDRWDSSSLSLLPIPSDILLPGAARVMLQYRYENTEEEWNREENALWLTLKMTSHLLALSSHLLFLSPCPCLWSLRCTCPCWSGEAIKTGTHENITSMKKLSLHQSSEIYQAA